MDETKEKSQNKIECNEQTGLSAKDIQGEKPIVQKTPKSRKSPIEFFMAEKDGKMKLSARKLDNHQKNELQRFTGTPNEALSEKIIASGTNALPESMSEATKNNIIIQTLADSTPRDSHEARLSVQAAVLYEQGLDFLERARRVLYDQGTFAKLDWHSMLMKTATKLIDLHTKTVEAIMRYRQQGEQRIVVQHVNVAEGGKALVGGVFQGGGVQQKDDEVTPC